MIDSNFYDVLAADALLYERCKELRAEGRLKFITTHIQQDQIRATPDASKREALNRIEASLVHTSAFAWDVSRFDLSEWTSDQDTVLIEEIIGDGNKTDITDALIAITAKYKTDAIVTNDKSLRKRLAKVNMPVKVLSADDFIAWVKTQ
jgi:hypothetical protein